MCNLYKTLITKIWKIEIYISQTIILVPSVYVYLIPTRITLREFPNVTVFKFFKLKITSKPITNAIICFIAICFIENSRFFFYVYFMIFGEIVLFKLVRFPIDFDSS